jgi:hypothetical protein
LLSADLVHCFFLDVEEPVLPRRCCIAFRFFESLVLRLPFGNIRRLRREEFVFFDRGSALACAFVEKLRIRFLKSGFSLLVNLQLALLLGRFFLGFLRLRFLHPLDLRLLCLLVFQIVLSMQRKLTLIIRAQVGFRGLLPLFNCFSFLFHVRRKLPLGLLPIKIILLFGKSQFARRCVLRLALNIYCVFDNLRVQRAELAGRRFSERVRDGAGGNNFFRSNSGVSSARVFNNFFPHMVYVGVC